MFNNGGYSLADIAAATGNENMGYGGNGCWWIVILFLLCGWGRNGWGGYGGEVGINSPAGQGALTRADLCNEFNFNNLDNAVRGIQKGLCDGFYAQNTTLMNGFHGVDNAICQLGYQNQQCCCDTQRAIDNSNFQTAQGINNIGTRIDACCCETQRQIERGFCDTNYNMATNTTSIIQNAHNDTDRVLARLDAMERERQQEKIQALQLENQNLKFAASQANQNSYLIATMDANQAELIRRLGRENPVPAYVVPNPNCCYGTPYGVLNNNYCGCNNNCCC